MSADPIGTSRRTLCVVTPCFNEGAGVREFYRMVATAAQHWDGKAPLRELG